MIDYLELIFSTKPENHGHNSVPDGPAAAVLPAGRHISEPEASTMIPQRGELLWQQEALRRVERAIDIPEEERPFPKVSRPEQRRAAEDLERRLRRSSRRYDSGFYLY